MRSSLLVLWLGASLAMAQEEGAASGKSYTTCYLLVVLIVGLGLMLVLRPVGRTRDVKPKQE